MTEMLDKIHTQSDNVTSGPIAKTIVSLALPVFLGMVMEFLLTVTDFFWVGKLGPSAQDAITSSMVVHWTVFGLFSMISIGITALVSRHVGARNIEQARFFIRQALDFALMLGAAISLFGYIFTEQILGVMETPQPTLVQAIPYLHIFFLSTILFAVAETIYAVFRASGDTRTPMKVAVMAVLINMILDPLLILGYGPFPKMGVPGAAIATFTAIFIACLTIIYLLIKGKAGYAVSHAFFARPDWTAIRKIARIGLPISSQQVTFVIVYWFLIAIVHQFGAEAGAAMGIGNRMESFSYLTCYGISLASSTMVGQNLGAGQPDRAAKCAWGAIGIAVGITAVISIFFLATPAQLADVFTNNARVKAIATDYLIILGLTQTAMAVELVLEGSFSGAGDTIPPMVVMIPGAIIRIPLAYWLSFDLEMGVNGVWWTLTITSALKAIILVYWFKLGHWKTKAV